MQPHFLKGRSTVQNGRNISLVGQPLPQHRDIFGRDPFGRSLLFIVDFMLEQTDALLNFIVGLGILFRYAAENIFVNFKRVFKQPH